MRAPFRVDKSKYRGIDGPVVFINKSAKKICSFIKRPRDPLGFENDAVDKTKIENIHSQGLEVRFGASDSNYSGGGLIISEDFNSLVFQLGHLRKQQVKNCFSSRNVELWPIFSLSHMPLTTEPSKVAENPPNATSLASENTTVCVANGGLIE